MAFLFSLHHIAGTIMELYPNKIKKNQSIEQE